MQLQVPAFIKQAPGLVTKNAPAILTGVGVVGVVGATYLTGKATFKAAEILAEAQDLSETPLTAKEKTLKVWTLYLPAVGVASTTIVAIIYANRINAKRMAALLTAYTAADKAYTEYQEKVREHLTGSKEEKIRSEITQDRVNREYSSNEAIFSPIDGKVLIREDYTGRYFWSTKELVMQAANEVNNDILRAKPGEKWATLSEFYDLLELPHTSRSDRFGFTESNLVSLEWTSATAPDDRIAVHAFDFDNHPLHDPEREASSFR